MANINSKIINLAIFSPQWYQEILKHSSGDETYWKAEPYALLNGAPSGRAAVGRRNSAETQRRGRWMSMHSGGATRRQVG